ncbi:hypothetical protein [Tautonia plasticadhaerens]|uniref:Large cysteine-rich periplasmic protein OmcB n=1 Tax=Tautonia plasticadhaerens TaxID=2527974 RepID=A0A518GUH3_9BACT|nr:hypothetical protein [Tautonia plasticadhaerens]QDV32237.1 Large cysteine-rich periplasmic protein OmcB precursor [Tautonia plasticadhaerens]
MTRTLAFLAASLSLTTAITAQVGPAVVPAGPGRFAITFDAPFISDSYPIGTNGHYNQLLGLRAGPVGLGGIPLPIGNAGPPWGPPQPGPPLGAPGPTSSPQAMAPASPRVLPSTPEEPETPPPPPGAPEYAPSPPGTTDAPEDAPSLRLTFVDLDDPVPVGSDVMFLVVVSNQGDLEETDIRVTVRLADGLRFGGISGAGLGEADGQVVTFDPIASLAPGEELRWRVLARAEQPGQGRTRAELAGEPLRAPASVVEPTSVVPRADTPPADAEPPSPPAPGLDLPESDAPADAPGQDA